MMPCIEEEGSLSISRGIPLSEESGIGALTLGGFLREVAALHTSSEAAVFHEEDGSVERVSYEDLWDRAFVVARALMASGVVHGTRVGLLMTNRPEFLYSTFGIALAGGVVVTFSTFSTEDELTILLEKSCCSVLLMERTVLKKEEPRGFRE